MDQDELVTDEIDAGEKLAREFDKSTPVKVAFWAKLNEEQQRYLYLASDEINDNNLDVAYGEILRLANALPSPYLDPFRIKLIDTFHPLAKAALEYHRRYPGRIATRIHGKPFGGISIVDAYIYPSFLSTPIPAA